MANATGYAVLCVFWNAVFFAFNLWLYVRPLRHRTPWTMLLLLGSWPFQLIGMGYAWVLMAHRVAGGSAEYRNIVRFSSFIDFLSIFLVIFWAAVFLLANLILYDKIRREASRGLLGLLMLSFFVELPAVLCLWFSTIMLIVPD